MVPQTGEPVTATCTFSWDQRGFVHATMKDGCEMELADAVENVAAMFQVSGYRRTRLLVDMRGVRSQSRDARRYFAGPEAERVASAVALLIGSPVSRVLANFFLRIMPLRVPTALFTDQTAAVSWLLENSA